MTFSIKDIPLEERPRERLLMHGPENLSSAELLAVILGSGTKKKSVLELSQGLINTFGGLAALSQASIEELCQVHGIGKAKAIQLKAAFSLGVKAVRQQQKEKRIDTPEQVYQYVRDFIENENREIFFALFLNAKGAIIKHEVISIGTLSKSLVHPRELFNPAIRCNAASIIIAHNHPSGDPTPSEQDRRVTRQLVEAGKIFNIAVNDHIVVGAGSFFSLRQRGMM